jgi:hypothetical protein
VGCWQFKNMQLLRGFFLSIANDIAAEMVAQILQLKILKTMSVAERLEILKADRQSAVLLEI